MSDSFLWGGGDPTKTKKQNFYLFICLKLANRLLSVASLARSALPSPGIKVTRGQVI